MRKIAKKDNNHREIVKALIQVGCSVLDIAGVGNGCPDLLVGYRGTNYLMEIKNRKSSYGKRGLKENQQKFANQWRGGQVYVVSTIEEALKIIRAI